MTDGPIIPEGVSLYQVLGISEDAGESDIKKAYHKKALVCHPDRVGSSGAEDFKKLGFAYSILKDEKKKSHYDATGSWESIDLGEENTVADFMKAMFREVTEADADRFVKKYRGSEQENEDLVAAFNKKKGDCLKTLGEIFFEDSKVEEEDRLVAAVQSLIDAGRLQSNPLWEKTRITEETKKTAAYKKRWAKRVKEAKEMEQEQAARKELLSKKNKKGTKKDRDLCQALREVMSTEYDSMWQELAKKHNVEIPEVDEDEFEKAKARIAKRGSAPAKKKPSAKAAAKSRKRAVGETDPTPQAEAEDTAPPTKRRVVKKVVKRVVKK
eukprot:TRINITY_DN20745_c0_g1_i1.p1 TRINITY_DN20745_c0_g1~~TRINITY_DN20745_c0_g1_i1.p1  ORF type:complete len:340 (+),score=179.12 TRINITY_DN20745_c0_g1_i1:45-1022(+)